MNWLDVIGRDHSKWVNMVKSFGETNYHEDIVQEVYIRLYNTYKDKNDNICLINGKSNDGLMYVILRNTYYIYNKGNQDGRQTKKIKKVEFIGYEKEETNDIQDEYGYGLFLNQLDKCMSKWSVFDRKLFQLYVGTYGTQNIPTHGFKMSLRKLEEETGIGLSTLFSTIKECKRQIKENLSEDWEDYMNEDYEHLK